MKDFSCFVGLSEDDHKKLQYVEPPVVSSHASATSPSTRSFPERSWDSSDEPGKQSVLHSRSAQRSFTGSCGYPVHRSWRQSIQMHFLEFKHAFTKSEYLFPLSFWMPSLNSRTHFLEFTHTEPKYTCVFPSRSQWAVAALNTSCTNDPYVEWQVIIWARWMSWSL